MSTNPGRAHVLVIGIDGVRYDTLRAATTPTIDAVAAAGFLAPVRVNPAGPTISGPSWATVASGALADRHGVTGNVLHGHRLAEYPDFLTRVRSALPGRETYAAADWPPMVTDHSGGPIYAGGGFCPYQDDPGADVGRWLRGDELVAADAARVLAARDVAASFVYFGGPDVVAHAEGVTTNYLAAVEYADSLAGLVLAAVAARPERAVERWTVLVLTDHGHLDAGGHGGESDAERTAWLAAAGPQVPTTPPADLEQADIHPHVLAALDIPVVGSAERPGAPLHRPVAV